MNLNRKLLFNDPGKNNLLNMIDKDNNIFRYTNRQRLQETKRLKNQHKIEKFKKKNKITEIEKELTDYRSKSCDYIVFKQYVKKKNEINNQLQLKYQETIFRRLLMHTYINTKRSEDKLIKKIKSKYEEDEKKLMIIYGDWGIGKQMQNFISTPNIHLKRKIASEIDILNIDEFRTSCLHYRTQEKCSNLEIVDAVNKSRRIHSVLTYQMENNRIGCINRDNNGVKGIRHVAMHWIKFNKRPKKYRRGYKLDLKYKGADELVNTNSTDPFKSVELFHTLKLKSESLTDHP